MVGFLGKGTVRHMKARTSYQAASRPAPKPTGRTLPPPTREQVAALAYAIWQDRGSPPGSDLDIWLEAERLLQGKAVRRPSTADDIPADPANPGHDPAVEGDAADDLLDAIVTPPQQRSATSL